MKKFILTATILLAGAANAESFKCDRGAWSKLL
jgi:hypothetical protein